MKTDAVSNRPKFTLVPIVLSDRKEHLETLHGLLAEKLPDPERANLQIVDGSLSPAQRKQRIDGFQTAIENGGSACLFGTSSLLGEGFDLPILDTLFLAMPISFKGRLIQYAGRLHRNAPEKSEIHIYDYLDEQLPLALSMYRKRLPAYRKMGYEIVTDEELLQ